MSKRTASTSRRSALGAIVAVPVGLTAGLAGARIPAAEHAQQSLRSQEAGAAGERADSVPLFQRMLDGRELPMANVINNLPLYAGNYGVVGDGVANDTVAAQAFLNLCAAAKRIAYFGGLTVKISGPLVADHVGVVFEPFGYGSAASPGFYVTESGYTAITFTGFAGDIFVNVYGDPSGGVRFNRAGALISDTRTVADGIAFGTVDTPFAGPFVRYARAYNLRGFGIKHQMCWDVTFAGQSVERCGSSAEYAWSEEGGLSSECHWLRIQVEEAVHKAMSINTGIVSCAFGKIHSERATGIAGSITWNLAGNRCTFNNIRIQANNRSIATAKLGGANCTYICADMELDVTQIEGVNGLGITLIEPVGTFTPFPGQIGHVTVIGGDISVLAVASNWHFVNSAIDLCEIGEVADESKVIFQGCQITTLRAKAGQTGSRAIFDSSMIGGGTLVTRPGSQQFSRAVFRNGSKMTVTGGSLAASFIALILDDSTLIADVTANTAAVVLQNSATLQGDLTIRANPQSLCDMSSKVSGTVTGWTNPGLSRDYLGALHTGTVNKNLHFSGGADPAFYMWSSRGAWIARSTS